MNVTKVSFYKEKIFSARWFQTWGTLLLGSMVIAVGYTFFMTPYQIVPGGIYGISTILNWKLGFPIGMVAGWNMVGDIRQNLHMILYNW